MLILVAGATGKIGLNVVKSALRRGHQVRAMGRSPLKLPEEIHQRLESFVEIEGFGDKTSLDSACKGIDAVICAYGTNALLLLDGQLALLRAAERAGIKRFHAASWNLVWDKMPLGTIESYDPVISFSRQAALSSPIKPVYTFVGVLATTLFGLPGSGALEGDSEVWSRKENGERMLNVVGEGDILTPFVLESEAADFAVAVTTSKDAEKGGSYRFCSDEFTLKDVATTYERIRGSKCTINKVMDVDSCQRAVEQSRKEAVDAGELNERCMKYLGLVYALYLAKGTYNPKPVDAAKFPDVPRTTLEEFIRNNSWL